MKTLSSVIRFFEAMLIVCRRGGDAVFCDPLTGLYNRLFFSEIAKKEIERARRHKHPLSVVLFDIDDFKKTNDAFGHHRGDEVLKRVAKAILGSCRKSDIAARWGGDEFLLLLPEASCEAAERMAERVLRSAGDVSLSYGINSWEDSLLSVEDFIAGADSKMYKSKKSKPS